MHIRLFTLPKSESAKCLVRYDAALAKIGVSDRD
jgi:hypothetical protein